MTPKDLKRWRKSLGLSQKEAAHALGLKRRVIQYYEKGERDGGRLEIPLYVRLACYALTRGVTDYDGPPEDDGKAGKPARKAAKAAARGNKGSKRLTASPESDVAPPETETAADGEVRAAETLLPDPLIDPAPAPGSGKAAARKPAAGKTAAAKRPTGKRPAAKRPAPKRAAPKRADQERRGAAATGAEGPAAKPATGKAGAGRKG